MGYAEGTYCGRTKSLFSEKNLQQIGTDWDEILHVSDQVAPWHAPLQTFGPSSKRAQNGGEKTRNFANFLSIQQRIVLARPTFVVRAELTFVHIISDITSSNC